VSDSFLRLADVQRRVPFSRSTIYLMISRASSRSRSALEPAPSAGSKARLTSGSSLASAGVTKKVLFDSKRDLLVRSNSNRRRRTR
jgi:hypothetical protein